LSRRQFFWQRSRRENPVQALSQGENVILGTGPILGYPHEAQPEKMTVSATDVAVEIIGMNKWYGDFHVLRDINLKVMKGNASSSPARLAPANRR
jgi:hypothetical protein